MKSSTTGACWNAVRPMWRCCERRVERFADFFTDRERGCISRENDYRLGLLQGVSKKILQPDKTGIIPVGGYTDNRKQSKKATAWLMLEGRKEGLGILQGRKGKERQLPELPDMCGRPLRWDAHRGRVQRALLAWSYVHAFSRHAYRKRGRHLGPEIGAHHFSHGAESADRI